MLTNLAQIEDIEAIRALEMEAFSHTWDELTYQREFKRADSLYTVAKIQNEVMASASIHWVLDEAELVSIVVAPQHQGQGFARQLLGENLAFCQQQNLSWMTLEVKWNNPPAFKLYKHFGFSTVGSRKAYYRDGQDARIMWSGCLKEASYDRLLHPYQTEALRLSTEWKDSRS